MSSELLKQIQAGKKLKKAEINDRSAPIIDAPKSGLSQGGTPSGATGGSSTGIGGGPPQLGGLFAGGMPKLKPAGQSQAGTKPSNLAKPPSIPKRDTVSPAAPIRSVPPPKPSSVPVPPSRPAPSVPARTVPSVPDSAPSPPRRAPPPLRTSSPPAPPARPSPAIPSRPSPVIPRPSPAIPPRNASPSSSPTASKIAPAIPPRMQLNTSSPTKSALSNPGRPPPPPPPRPSSMVSPSTAQGRTVPPPPARNPPAGGAPPLPSRIRTASEIGAVAGPARTPPPAPPARSSLAPPKMDTGSATGALSPIPSRRVASNVSNGVPRRKIPSPPPNAGVHTFPVTDFPPPREFEAKMKQYGSGRTRGSDFDTNILV